MALLPRWGPEDTHFMFSRRLLPTLAVVLTIAGFAHADDVASYTVVIAEPHYALVPANDHLIALCGPHTEGCTQITGTSFSAVCSPSEDRWRMTPSVSFIPYVYIGAAIGARVHHIYTHEMAHLDDVQRSMEAYVHRIAVTPFASLQQCRETADLERSRIAEVTRTFARQSFEVRR
jgi:hypothetical protein